MLNPWLIVVALLLIVVVVLAVLLADSRAQAGEASRSRNSRAQVGEQRAQELLAEHGYRVVDRQVTATGSYTVDGELVSFSVRADLVCCRAPGQPRDGPDRYVAEVKTGSLAPSPAYPPTRRQLREYAAVFADHGLLLVDVEAEQVVTIEFS